jgi:N-acyl-D-amino-acid deacylase
VREHCLFSLEEAVYKMTAFPAERFGLKDRGVLDKGRFADITVFDPDGISDPATYAEPHQYAVGMAHVIVNGRPIIQEGAPDGASVSGKIWPGRYLRLRQ